MMNKKLLFLINIILISVMSSQVVARDVSTTINDCIAENSGAGGIDCLQAILNDMDKKLHSAHQEVMKNLKQKWQQHSITETHYLAASEKLQATEELLKRYRESLCDALASSTGAVASGYQDYRLACLIRYTQSHIESIQHEFLYK